MDSVDQCRDRAWFKQYPYSVEYRYNSRGYRDQEWPDSINELKHAIWCVGDSFTVGLGSPVEHTWPRILQQQLQTRTINVSLDGASNEWIARKTTKLLVTIAPKLVVIHWSYLHRREIDKDQYMQTRWEEFYKNIADPLWPDCPSWPNFNTLPENIKHELHNQHQLKRHLLPESNYEFDEERRINFILDSDHNHLQNTICCIQQVEELAHTTGTTIIHSVVPNFTSDDHSAVANQQLKALSIKFIPEFKRLDWARDKHHYDIQTSQYFVQQIVDQL